MIDVYRGSNIGREWNFSSAMHTPADYTRTALCKNFKRQAAIDAALFRLRAVLSHGPVFSYAVLAHSSFQLQKRCT